MSCKSRRKQYSSVPVKLIPLIGIVVVHTSYSCEGCKRYRTEYVADGAPGRSAVLPSRAHASLLYTIRITADHSPLTWFIQPPPCHRSAAIVVGRYRPDAYDLINVISWTANQPCSWMSLSWLNCPMKMYYSKTNYEVKHREVWCMLSNKSDPVQCFQLNLACLCCVLTEIIAYKKRIIQ